MTASLNANLFARLFDDLDDPSKLAIETAEAAPSAIASLLNFQGAPRITSSRAA